jgi:hypothetical protein
LASVNHSVAEIDKWEQAHFKEDEIRGRVKAAKKQYEDALREKFFGFQKKAIYRTVLGTRPRVPLAISQRANMIACHRS